MSDTINHPVMGELRWEEEWSWWFGQVERPDGGSVDLFIHPGTDEEAELLERAAELFRWALGAQWRLIREAVEVELLTSYNDGWRQEGEQELSATELTDRLTWGGLVIDASDDPIVPVSFQYDDDELFGSHLISVDSDRELRYRGIRFDG